MPAPGRERARGLARNNEWGDDPTGHREHLSLLTVWAEPQRRVTVSPRRIVSAISCRGDNFQKLCEILNDRLGPSWKDAHRDRPRRPVPERHRVPRGQLSQSVPAPKRRACLGGGSWCKAVARREMTAPVTTLLPSRRYSCLRGAAHQAHPERRGA